MEISPWQHVGVKANVVDIKTGAEQTTNDFRFTWCPVTVPTGSDSLNVRMVVPKSYKGVMTVYEYWSNLFTIYYRVDDLAGGQEGTRIRS